MNSALIYITCKDQNEAESLSQVLLNEKLIACSNIIPSMISVFNWNDKIESNNETVLLLKTKTDLFSEIETLVTEHHSYQVPCIIMIPTAQVNSSYQEWMSKEIK